MAFEHIHIVVQPLPGSLLEYFHLPQKRNWCSLAVTLRFSTTPAPGNHFVSLDVPVLGISFTQFVSFCDWLLSGSIFSRFIYIVTRMYQCFQSFLWLNDIPAYGCTAFCLSIHKLMDICVSTF